MRDESRQVERIHNAPPFLQESQFLCVPQLLGSHATCTSSLLCSHLHFQAARRGSTRHHRTLRGRGRRFLVLQITGRGKGAAAAAAVWRHWCDAHAGHAAGTAGGAARTTRRGGHSHREDGSGRAVQVRDQGLFTLLGFLCNSVRFQNFVRRLVQLFAQGKQRSHALQARGRGGLKRLPACFIQNSAQQKVCFWVILRISKGRARRAVG